MPKELPIKQIIFGDNVSYVIQNFSVLPSGDGQKKMTPGKSCGLIWTDFYAAGNWQNVDARLTAVEGANEKDWTTLYCTLQLPLSSFYRNTRTPGELIVPTKALVGSWHVVNFFRCKPPQNLKSLSINWSFSLFLALHHLTRFNMTSIYLYFAYQGSW